MIDAFVEVQLDWSTVPVVERFDHTMASGASATSELLDRDSGLTAIVCTSDVLALGAFAEIRRRGLRVPEAERIGLVSA